MAYTYKHTHTHTRMMERRGMISDNKKLAIMHAIMRPGRCLRGVAHCWQDNESAAGCFARTTCRYRPVALHRLSPRMPCRPMMRHAIGDAENPCMQYVVMRVLFRDPCHVTCVRSFSCRLFRFQRASRSATG